MRSYEAARTLFSFLGFIAWSVIVIGVLVALVGAGSVSQYAGGGAGLLAMVPGFGIAIAGFILLAFVQMGRAGVDTAEYTQQMLKISRDQLEVSRQALKGDAQQLKRFEAIKNPEKSGAGFEKADFSPRGQAQKQEEAITKIPPPKPEMKDGEALEYLGQTIKREQGMFLVGGQSFNSLNYAKNFAERARELHEMRKN